MSESPLTGVHPDFYPCTNGTHWEPLLAVAPEAVGEFMFMQADPAGRFYYKHSATRSYVILDDAGHAFDGQGLPCDARIAVEAARGGVDWGAL